MAIYQSFLDRSGEALVAGDGDAFLDLMVWPHTLMTEDETFFLESRETGRMHFHGFSNALRAQGVDSYTRVATAAQFIDDVTLTGEHKSYITARGKLIVPVFENEATLTLSNGVWGCNRIRHFTKYVAWPDILPRAN